MQAHNVFTPHFATVNELSISHCHDYLQQLIDPVASQDRDSRWRRIGLPWSRGLIERTFTAPNGTLLAARLALKYGMASHIAGGTHHAHFDFGSGFCMINDLAYTAQSLLASNEINSVLIFDLDVHQGDGTAAILANEPRAFTCSIHCEKNFPFRKSKSDLYIGLEVGLTDQPYLQIVEQTLADLLSRLHPDLVLYDAGVDVWQQDQLGHLNISQQGIIERDERVLSLCLQHHIPVATVIGGGYDKDHDRLAKRHASIVETAAYLYAKFYI